MDNNLTHSEEVYGYHTDSAGNLHWFGVYSGHHKIVLDNNVNYIKPVTYFVEKMPGIIEEYTDPAGNKILVAPHINNLKKLIVEMEFENGK